MQGISYTVGTFTRPTTGFDYDKRVEMIPMRDGVKLYTVIVVTKGAKGAPMILTRTPYDAAGRATRAQPASMLATLPQGDEVFVADGTSASSRPCAASTAPKATT